jgi:hypothetical protein
MRAQVNFGLRNAHLRLEELEVGIQNRNDYADNTAVALTHGHRRERA